MLVNMNTKLMRSKGQLLSQNGLRGQLCMQTCAGHNHNKSNSSKKCDVPDENILTANSDSFVWNHFGSLQTNSKDGAFELYLDGGNLYAIKDVVRNTPVWKPLTKFPCCHQNSLLYLVMGGLCDEKNFCEPLRMKTVNGSEITEYNTREAFDIISEKGNVAASRTAIPHGNANAVSRSGDVLENIACISSIMASHRNGMGGSIAAVFLLMNGQSNW